MAPATGVAYDADLGNFGGFSLSLAVDGVGDGVIGDIDAVATVPMLLSDERQITEPETLLRLTADTGNNVVIVHDPQALGVPEPNSFLGMAMSLCWLAQLVRLGASARASSAKRHEVSE